jgi:hypothetical protein
MSDQTQIARIELNDTDRLVISTNEYRGKQYVDIRKFVESESYTGPTKQGVRFSVDLLPELLQGIKKLVKHAKLEEESTADEEPIAKVIADIVGDLNLPSKKG